MKLALIGDPHFANRKLFGHPVADMPGVNTRLRAVSNTLDWIRKDIVARSRSGNIQEVAILGDITHDHGKLTPPVLSEVLVTFYKYAESNLNLTILAGNHDIDSTGGSINGAFANHGENGYGVMAVDVPMQVYYSFPYPIYGIPYCSAERALDFMESIKGKAAMLLMHHSFEGAKHGVHEYEPPGGIPPALVPDYFQVYSGHYHLRQSLKPTLTYVGGPLQHDFGESNYVPGYVIIDFDEDPHEYTFIETPAAVAPRFHILPHNLELDDLPGLPETDYYRIDLPQDVDPTEIIPLRDKLNHVIVKILPISVQIRSRVEEHLQKDVDKLDVFDVVEAYGAMNAVPERADDLIELGKDIVTNA